MVHKNGCYSLVLDGKLFFILGAQSNNSSACPATLPKVWLTIEKPHVNTLDILICREQFEPQSRKYNYCVVDTIITQAQESNLRLVLLWFATWKNGPNYTCRNG